MHFLFLIISGFLFCAMSFASTDSVQQSIQNNAVRLYQCDMRDLIRGREIIGPYYKIEIAADQSTAKIRISPSHTDILILDKLKKTSSETYFTSDDLGRLKLTFDISPDKKTGVFLYRNYVCDKPECDDTDRLESSTQIFICSANSGL